MVGIQLSLFGRTYPAHSLVIMDTIFKPCLKKSQKPIFQCLQVENGQAQEWFEGGQSVPLGDCLTLNIGECPSEESESTLSEVLEVIVPQKYYLSRTACDGILRRAERRGRTLDEILTQALKEANSFLTVEEARLVARKPKCYRKTAHPRNNKEPQGFKETQTADTLNLFDNTESRTPILIVMPVIYAIDRAAFNQGENALYDFSISQNGIAQTIIAKGPSAVAYALQGSMFGREDQNGPNGNGVNKDVCFTLNTADRHGVAYEMTVEEFVYWCVRRLTPKECERLQGYPDFWTVLRKITTMADEEYEFYKAAYVTDKEIKGKTVRRIPTKKQLINWHNKLDVDGTRYRQLGNSLAIPCALRVIGYIADYIRREV